jgi:hypothetical protein
MCRLPFQNGPRYKLKFELVFLSVGRAAVLEPNYFVMSDFFSTLSILVSTISNNSRTVMGRLSREVRRLVQNSLDSLMFSAISNVAHFSMFFEPSLNELDVP